MDLNLKNKTAFISGSTSGIGYTTAKILLQEGMKVYIVTGMKNLLHDVLNFFRSVNKMCKIKLCVRYW